MLATEAGIEAAASLQREDGINVNLTSVSGVMHAAACARAGAVAVTLPIAKVCLSFFAFSFLLIFLFLAFFRSLEFIIWPRKTLTSRRNPLSVFILFYSIQIREWHRTMGRQVAESREGSGAAGGEEDVETIAAYFELHDFSPTTGLIATEMDDVRTIYVLFSPLSPRSRLEDGLRKRSRTDD